MRRTSDKCSAVPTLITFTACVAFGGAATAIAAEPDKDVLIRDALSAAPPAIASTATVMTMDNKVLKQGTGSYVCMPTDADELAKGLREPMCLDKVWVAWADAWMNKKPFKATGTGIAYMLAGDAGGQQYRSICYCSHAGQPVGRRGSAYYGNRRRRGAVGRPPHRPKQRRRLRDVEGHALRAHHGPGGAAAGRAEVNLDLWATH